MNKIHIGLVSLLALHGLLLAQAGGQTPTTSTVWEATIRGVSG